jgi:NADPH:quinone reductase-like Zn-dependent oxidoreductase
MQSLPTKMRGVLLTGCGGFEKLEYRDDLPLPEFGSLDVLIRVGAASVNNTDINTRTGWYSNSVSAATEDGAADGFCEAKGEDASWTGTSVDFPRIQGADVCGQIVATGANVDPARIGERVLVEPMFRGQGEFDATYFGSEVDGGFADYVSVPSIYAHRVISTWSDIELATFPCAYSTAENMLTRAKVVQNERVLITGASGGVGSAAVQLAKRRGARVTAIVGGDKAKAISQLGAEQVVSRNTDLVSAFGREHFDVTIDVVGGNTFPALLDCLRRGGRYAGAGAIAGPIVSLDLRKLYLKELQLIGCTILNADVFQNLVGYIERGEIKPLVAGTYPLSEIVAAQRTFVKKDHVGKIVLVP